LPATDGASSPTNPDVDPFNLSAIVYRLVKLFMSPHNVSVYRHNEWSRWQ